MQNLGPYLAIITAIVAAYLTYRSQLRLKTFELLFERRESILTDVEEFLATLYGLKLDLEEKNKSERIDKYTREYFHNGLILYHKVKGASFGGASEEMAETFWTIIQEPLFDETMSLSDFEHWISRTTNVLSALYGVSHRQFTSDLEHMAFSPVSRLVRKHRNRLGEVKRRS